jgi:hypothetical protein
MSARGAELVGPAPDAADGPAAARDETAMPAGIRDLGRFVRLLAPLLAKEPVLFLRVDSRRFTAASGGRFYREVEHLWQESGDCRRLSVSLTVLKEVSLFAEGQRAEAKACMYAAAQAALRLGVRMVYPRLIDVQATEKLLGRFGVEQQV